MPSLSSFVSSNQYFTESTTLPLYAGMILGSPYNSGFTFDGTSGAAGSDPGGLFGWLTYSRAYLYGATPKGSTTSQYILYTTPQDLIGDLNKLSGITSCLISNPTDGGTYGFFVTNGTVDNVVRVVPQTPGTDLLHALSYLAYGGNLVLVGEPSGFDSYITDSEIYLDLVIGKEGNTSACQWLIDQPYTAGVFPTIPANSGSLSGYTGAGYTMADYATLFNDATLVTGTTVANRIFNVYGVKTVTDLDTTTLLSNSKLTYTIPAVGDVGGFFTRSKNRKEQYLTVAGVDRATVLNGNVVNPINWTDSLKNTFRTNRVNFFVNYNPKFLGSDLTGATASATFSSDDRIGPSRLKSALQEMITQIALKYLFDINNASTRAQVTAEVETGLDPFAPYIDTTQTQILCDATNNQDNSSSLTIEVVIKPIYSIDSFAINITLTQ
jgi:hypothetical protein